MTGPTAADLLGDMIEARSSYQDDLRGLESLVSKAFLTGNQPETLADDLVDRLLRYADIMSHSTKEQHRESAYTIIALLREFQELVGLSDRSAIRVSAVASAVLVELGNFPGLRTLANGTNAEYTLPLSRGILRVAKEVAQATKHGDQTLTDTQFEITERMRGRDFFSFSGPTSLGKSFILKDAIYDIVTRSELDGHCVVVLVPTKALIGQTAADLRDLLQGVPEVNIATFPALPRFLRKTYPRTIFVFTPERLLRYLADGKRDIDYLIIDEAQKIISTKDARSSIYYHAIVETIRRFATKLVFASPSIENPELFLELFDKAPIGAFAVQERTVSQQRYFVDLVDRKQYYLPGTSSEQVPLEQAPVAKSTKELVTTLSGERKSIIYINSSERAADFAVELAATLPEISDPKIDQLAKFVKEHVHKDYYLTKTLKHGVAFHHGKMPQEIREKVESLFSDPSSKLQFVACTSTLLEGVNLPAKNIFIVNDKHGPASFGKIDFENLVGRAGRLTYDFSGNVVCVRQDERAWQERTRSLIPRGKPITAESFLVNPGRRTKPFTDIAKVLQGKPLAKNTTADEQRIVEQYSSILLLHLMGKQQTPLRTLFTEKVNEGAKLLEKSVAEFDGSTDVLRHSPGILPKYQAQVWKELLRGTAGPLVPADTEGLNYDICLDILTRLGKHYNWIAEEARGRLSDRLVPPTEPGYSDRLKYWATLMSFWIKGEPLVRVIKRSISYYTRQGVIEYVDYSRSPEPIKEDFNPTSTKHINIIIEGMMKDLETGLRFKIISYLENYYDLSVQALGQAGAGLNIAKLVEYGSADAKVINLQEVGFSRLVALELLKKHSKMLVFTSNDELDHINAEDLLAVSDLGEDVRNEILNVLKISTSEPSGAGKVIDSHE